MFETHWDTKMDLQALINSGFLSLSALEEKYALYKQNPDNVDDSWRLIFDQLEAQHETLPPVSQQQDPFKPLPPKQAPISITPQTAPELASMPALEPLKASGGQSVLYYPRVEIGTAGGDWRIFNLLQAYRGYGHLMAKTNPIVIEPMKEPHELRLETLGFSKQDLPTHFPTCGLLPEEKAPLLEILNALKATYSDKIGVEYIGLQKPELEKWLQERIEPNRFRVELSIDQKRMILEQLNKSELFESFLHTKYVGQKRFSIEGAETLIPMLAAIVDTGAQQGMEEFVFGMAHRGRLNVLSNILDKSYADIFSEFEEGYIPASVEGSGDVKYHKGFYSEVKTLHGHQVKLTLTPNPSHLEAVDPVVEGRVKARQIQLKDDLQQEKVVPVLVHGDAAIAAQGVVYETLQMSKLEGYSTGGTIHIVVNNQIGFTTLPKDGRSTYYCTDIARSFGAPVFHVNAEDPEGCVYVTNLAIELRQKFHCDVFIDLNCYRKYGHNEGDEPAFTQPLEYQVIRMKKPIREIYRDALIHQGVLEKYMAEALEVEFKTALQQAMQSKRSFSKDHDNALDTSSSKSDGIFQPVSTGVPLETLQQVGQRICSLPDGFTVHPKLAILNKQRLDMLKVGKEGHPLDWGMAELLAYGSLLWEGRHVRLSGQDSCRGTFSHRHSMFMDQVKEQGYIPLKHLKPGQGRFDVYNSPLSEYGVLGFEFGYSTAYPDALVIWEAQFGDFSNGAQIIIDQFISTAEQKWMLKFGLTLLLPHGYEGQGPEHSSGRIERFLALAGDHNMQIVNPTTPAQLFHLLRRQVVRPLRKPLIVFTPKGLLRHTECVSPLEDLTKGSFQEVLMDPEPPAKARRLVFCSGRFFYDLIAERKKTNSRDMMIVRIEQLYPLDIEKIKAAVAKCPGLQECIWVQEEPSNMGGWNFMRHILHDILPKDLQIYYVGRMRSASPAAGSHALHKKEHMAIMNALFGKKELSDLHFASQLKA